MTFHFALVDDLLSREEFDRRVGEVMERSGDLLAEDRDLPPVEAGDLVAVLDAGAYGFAMASQYNGRPRCAEVLVRGEDAALMRRRETVGDLTAAAERLPWQVPRREP